ncbi:hypothetical protein [Micromonospora sp. NPDC050695]|uniref:hypothetical protein n=1 Tax=Micromonospora sp. NPDC050695 TaxID=3154938 RepID=UPI0033EE5972
MADDSVQFAIILHHGDRSGVQGAWGPYPSVVAAEEALQHLKSWPMDGLWEIQRLLPPIGGKRP